MVKHRLINFICVGVIVAAMVFAALFSYTSLLGVEKAQSKLSYQDKLFDDSVVHSLDISVDESDWAELIENASGKEYTLCSLTIDGESFSSAAIRTKGNTSLSSVQSLGGERYSFKVEFDHYQNGLTYYGLDKLSLNNLIFDKTYLKDFIVYDMMDYMGVDTPLASFVLITVNGEPWGLYLAVEGVEEAFAERNYGHDYDGELYKPDSFSMGADGEEAENENAAANGDVGFSFPSGGQIPNMNGFELPEGMTLPEGMVPPNGAEMPNFGDAQSGATVPGISSDAVLPAVTPDASANNAAQPSAMPDASAAQDGSTASGTQGGRTNPGGGWGGMFGGSSNDVALVYSDDSFSSYSHIFAGAIFDDVTDADKRRLIASLKQMNEGENLDEVMDVEEVLKYFVVHNFSLNFDSYTGSLMHNYYLYEENGKLSMIPWDYNLAFGSFNMGGGGSTSGVDSATSLVNFPIDTPVSGTTISARPLLSALLSNETYLAQYHEYFDEFIAGYFESGYFEELMERIVSLIGPYVSEDATAFYTYDEFVKGASALESFCLLRAESIRGQLSGTIPSTSEAQSADSSNLVDASTVTVSDMGSMSGMGGGGRNFKTQNQNPGTAQSEGATPPSSDNAAVTPGATTQSGTMPQQPWGETGEQAAPPSGTGAAGEGSTPSQTPSVSGKTGGNGAWGGGQMPPGALGGTMPQMPPGQQGGGGQWSTGNGTWENGTPVQFGNQNGSIAESSRILWLVGSAALLVAGLLFAALYKRRR